MEKQLSIRKNVYKQSINWKNDYYKGKIYLNSNSFGKMIIFNGIKTEKSLFARKYSYKLN